jgi:hypothetical protein
MNQKENDQKEKEITGQVPFYSARPLQRTSEKTSTKKQSGSGRMRVSISLCPEKRFVEEDSFR